MIPVGHIQWLVLVVATLFSSVFVLKSTWPSIRDGAPAPQGRALVLAMFVTQVAFGIVLKIYFFNFKKAEVA